MTRERLTETATRHKDDHRRSRVTLTHSVLRRRLRVVVVVDPQQRVALTPFLFKVKAHSYQCFLWFHEMFEVLGIVSTGVAPA